MTDQDARLDVTVDGSATVVTLVNPAHRNALTPSMLQALPAVLARAGADGASRAVVIRGETGSGFCAGFDLSDLQVVDPNEVDAVLSAAMDAVSACELPVVAVIEQWCVGAGIELALACDLRVAAPGTGFRLPAAQLGITYPRHGLARIVAATGRAGALRVVLLGERIDAAAAHDLGLVHEVADDPSARAREWVERMASFDHGAIAAMKNILSTL